MSLRDEGSRHRTLTMYSWPCDVNHSLIPSFQLPVGYIYIVHGRRGEEVHTWFSTVPSRRGSSCAALLPLYRIQRTYIRRHKHDYLVRKTKSNLHGVLANTSCWRSVMFCWEKRGLLDLGSSSFYKRTYGRSCGVHPHRSGSEHPKFIRPKP